MKASKITQYSVFLVNEPGALKVFLSRLKDKGIRICALFSETKFEATILKFIVEGTKNADLNQIMTSAGYTNIETEALLLEMQNSVNELEKMSEILTANKVNICSIFGSCRDNINRFVITTDNLEVAFKLLNTD
jgi:hypothetical protein